MMMRYLQWFIQMNFEREFPYTIDLKWNCFKFLFIQFCCIWVVKLAYASISPQIVVIIKCIPQVDKWSSFDGGPSKGLERFVNTQATEQ